MHCIVSILGQGIFPHKYCVYNYSKEKLIGDGYLTKNRNYLFLMVKHSLKTLRYCIGESVFGS